MLSTKVSLKGNLIGLCTVWSYCTEGNGFLVNIEGDLELISRWTAPGINRTPSVKLDFIDISIEEKTSLLKSWENWKKRNQIAFKEPEFQGFGISTNFEYPKEPFTIVVEGDMYHDYCVVTQWSHYKK